MQSLISRRPAPGTRRDPAPSKWDYRLQRWMLTPYVRGFLLKGLPSLVVAGGFALWFAQEPNRQALIGQLSLLRDQFEARPEFRVSLARIEGASDDLAEAVRENWRCLCRCPLSTSIWMPRAPGSRCWMP